MSKSKIVNQEVVTSCFSIEIQPKEDRIFLKYSDYVDGEAVAFVGSRKVAISKYESDPRFAPTMAFIKEIAQEMNTFEEQRLQAIEDAKVAEAKAIEDAKVAEAAEEEAED